MHGVQSPVDLFLDFYNECAQLCREKTHRERRDQLTDVDFAA